MGEELKIDKPPTGTGELHRRAWIGTGGTATDSTAGLQTAGGIALVVYYKFGVSLLRQTWFNLDRAWAVAMIVAGVVAVAV